MIGAKIHMMSDNVFAFHCPGCEYGHAVAVNGARMENGAAWQWNGSLGAPTFQPSLLINKDLQGDSPRCHSFVKNGRIQFLNDSTHKLAGQTVELPDWED